MENMSHLVCLHNGVILPLILAMLLLSSVRLTAGMAWPQSLKQTLNKLASNKRLSTSPTTSSPTSDNKSVIDNVSISKVIDNQVTLSFNQELPTIAATLLKQVDSQTSLMSEKFSSFLAQNPSIPMIQRALVEERVQHFTSLIQSDYDKTKEIRFLGILSVALTEQQQKYIVDGQHRFQSYLQFMQSHPSIDFDVVYLQRYCSTQNQLRDYFYEINNQMKIDDYLLKSMFESPRNFLVDHLKQRYPQHISNSMKPKFPNIHIDAFIKMILERFPNQNNQELVQSLELWNEDVGKSLAVIDKIKYQQAKGKQGLFLAYMMRKETRSSIKASVRNILWRNAIDKLADVYLDKYGGKVPCYCCKTLCKYEDFHAGHKISVYHGGTDDISNLEVVCKLCNLSMQTEDMESYRRKYFGSLHKTNV